MAGRRTSGGPVDVRRAAAVLLGALVLAGGAWGLALCGAWAAGRVAAPGPARLDDLVVVAAAFGGAALAAWLAVGVLVSVLGILTRRGARVLPVGLHHLVAGALGLALVATAAAPAVTAAVRGPAAVAAATTTSADDVLPDVGWRPAVPPGEAAAPAPDGPALVDPGWRATGPVASDPGWTPSAPPPVPRVAEPADPVVVAAPRPDVHAEPLQVVVRRGDTLWDLAARHLPAGATDAEIAAAWPRWWEANRAVVGDDPDRLLPGQLLVAPW